MSEFEVTNAAGRADLNKTAAKVWCDAIVGVLTAGEFDAVHAYTPATPTIGLT
jgi:hypothetical protein